MESARILKNNLENSYYVHTKFALVLWDQDSMVPAQGQTSR